MSEGTYAESAQTYSCAIDETFKAAFAAAGQGRKDAELQLTGDTFALPRFGLSGKVGAEGSSDVGFLSGSGPFFETAPARILNGANGLAMGRAAMSHDASGVLTAYLALYGGSYHAVCIEASAAAANFNDSPQVQTSPPAVEVNKELTGEQKDELRFANSLEQKGNEQKIFGPPSIAMPDEGHYTCKTTSYFSDGSDKTHDGIGNDDGHIGFDLFRDGTYRLQKKDGSLEKDGGPWRHNAQTGTVLFADGTLEIYFKWPVHVRKKLENRMEASLFYDSVYDYDGSIDRLDLCVFAGPPLSKSPKQEIAERARKNLSPPPPGQSVRSAGLYYQQKWVTMMGFSSGTMPAQIYQKDYYYYRYLQANGYVWLGDPPADGDFAKLDCSKPIVDQKGEPICTSYAVEDGLFSKPTIRIGNDAPLPFEEGDGSVSIDGTQFVFVPPQNHRIIEKSVRYFNFNGMAMREGHFTFHADGTFQSSSASGINYVSEIPDVARTTVTSYNPGNDLQGSYEINGHTLTTTLSDGQTAKTFFGYFGDNFFMIGNQPYFESSK